MFCRLCPLCGHFFIMRFKTAAQSAAVLNRRRIPLQTRRSKKASHREAFLRIIFSFQNPLFFLTRRTGYRNNNSHNNDYCNHGAAIGRISGIIRYIFSVPITIAALIYLVICMPVRRIITQPAILNGQSTCTIRIRYITRIFLLILMLRAASRKRKQHHHRQAHH